MSPIPESQALAIDALSQDWQGQSMYMFPPLPLFNKVIHIPCATQEGETLLITPWWPSQPWFPRLLQLCVEHPCIISYRRDLLSEQSVIPSARMEVHMQHYQAAGFSGRVSRLITAPRRHSTNHMYDDRWLSFAHWATGQGTDPRAPKAPPQIATFL